jgi:hypothetical protein
MPALIWRSLTAWLYDRPSAGGVAVAEALATASPDRLTRLLLVVCLFRVKGIL